VQVFDGTETGTVKTRSCRDRFGSHEVFAVHDWRTATSDEREREESERGKSLSGSITGAPLVPSASISA